MATSPHVTTENRLAEGGRSRATTPGRHARGGPAHRRGGLTGRSPASGTAALNLDHIRGVLRPRIGARFAPHGSSGVPDDELVGAVDAGKAKVNVSTRLNAAFADEVERVRRLLSGHHTVVSP